MMALYKVSNIPVIAKDDSFKVIGIISHRDVLTARRRYLERKNLYHKHLSLSKLKNNK